MLVIGAGVAGLTAAQALRTAGVPVTVLEARDRLGGRAFTAELAGGPVELGAGWVQGVQGSPLAAYCGAHDIEVVPDPVVESLPAAFDRCAGPLPPERMAELRQAVASFQRAVPRLRRELGPRASFADAVAAELQRTGAAGDFGRQLAFACNLLNEDEYAGPSERTSLEWIFEDIDHPGGFHALRGGMRRLVHALAAGVDVHLRAIVEAVDATGPLVEVHTHAGVFRGDRVIVTVPLGVLQSGSIRFAPGLPKAKADALARLEMATLEKVALRFAQPFWRQSGSLSFLHLSDPARFPSFLDATAVGGAPTLLCLHGGGAAREVLDTRSDDEIRDEVLALLATVTGRVVPAPLACAVTRWRSDPFARGSYAYIPVGASPADFAALAEPMADGRILFAGEATIADQYQTLHGAMTSALREVRRLGVPILVPGLEPVGTDR